MTLLYLWVHITPACGDHLKELGVQDEDNMISSMNSVNFVKSVKSSTLHRAKVSCRDKNAVVSNVQAETQSCSDGVIRKSENILQRAVNQNKNGQKSLGKM